MWYTVLAEVAKIDPDKVGIPKVDADTTVTSLLNVVYFLAAAAAIIVIILGGIFYSISNGDSSKVKFAKDSILYAVVGLVVVMLAFVITNFIIGKF